MALDFEKIRNHTRESIGGFTHLGGIVPRRKGDHRGDLQKAHLKGVRRADFHTMNFHSVPLPPKFFLTWGQNAVRNVPKGNVAVHSK